MIASTFDYARPAALDEAARLLAGPDAVALAGGHVLVPAMRSGSVAPVLVVDLGALPGLDDITVDGDGLRLGALVTLGAVATSDRVRGARRALAEAARAAGDAQARNRATVGGNVALAERGTDLPAALLALGAQVVVHGAAGERTADLPALSLVPGEVVTAVRLPAPPADSAYCRQTDAASRWAVVGVAAARAADGSTRLGVVAGGAPALVELPAGASPQDVAAAVAGVPVVGSRTAGEPYRRHLVGVLAARALARLG